MEEFIDELVDRLQQLGANGLEVTFGQVAEFAPSLFALALLIYVFVVGVMLLAGLIYTINKFVFQIFIFVALFAFATQYQVIALPIYELIVGWIKEFTEVRGVSFGKAMSDMLKLTTDYVSKVADQMTFGTRTVALLLMTVLISIPTVIMLGLLFMTYLMAFMVAALVTAVLPIMFIFGMFAATRDMLTSTLRLLMQYFILGILAVLMLHFAYYAVLFSNLRLVEMLTEEQPFLNAVGMAFVIYTMLLITLQIPNLAASIAGGLALHVGGLAQNTAGAALNLARRTGRGLITRSNQTSRITRNSAGNIRGSNQTKGIGRSLRKLTQKSTYRKGN